MPTPALAYYYLKPALKETKKQEVKPTQKQINPVLAKIKKGVKRTSKIINFAIAEINESSSSVYSDENKIK